MSAFELLYLTLISLISMYGLHRYWLIWGSLKRPIETPSVALPPRDEDYPHVLIQLPIFNEPGVFRRLIDAACAIDWPRDRVVIQVLDDSTDGSSTDVAAVVEERAAAGVPIVHLHREDREGYKAGALQAGLEQSSAQFVAIFDADFVPPRDFVRRVVAVFLADERIGMVQTRWGFSNPRASWLTRIQATLLDGHFHVEHRARARAGRFFNFNGTAGMWRVATIEDAGGWKADTVTEDLELSLRAWLRRWKFHYLGELECPSDLPDRLAAFKIQQHRWVSGSMHTAVTWLGPILRSRLRLSEKIDLCFQLTGNVNYLLLWLLVLSVPPAVLTRMADGHRWLAVDSVFFAFATVSVLLFYGRARRPGTAPLRYFVTRVPGLMALGLGMTVHNSRAVIRGVLGRSRVFERTPKEGAADLRQGQSWLRNWVSWVEMAMATYVIAAIVVTARGGSWLSAPLLGLFAAGYLWIWLGGWLRPRS